MHPSESSRRHFMEAAVALSASVGGLLPRLASAQPSTGLHVLCGGPPGSVPDNVARRYAEQLASGRTGGALVENRPGAAFQIAISALRQAPADGHTLLLAPSAISAVYPYLYSKLNYDPDTDIRPVSAAAEATLALAVGPAVPESVRNLRDFAEWLRANPRLANYGSPGQGTLPHVLSAMYFREARVDAQHAGYAGGPPAIVDLIGGRIAALSLPEGLLRPHVEAKKLRMLATSGSARSPFMPDVATFVEQGYPDLVVREWFAFYAPAATPPSAIGAAARAIRTASEQQPLMNAFREMGMTPIASSPEATAERIAIERRYWQKMLAATGIRAEL